MPKEKSDIWRSKLEAHKRVGKQLIPPFQSMGIATNQIYWWRDILPEFLWIDSLVQQYGESAAWTLFGDFLSSADRFNANPNEILDGTVSAFLLIPADRRQEFREKLGMSIRVAIIEPFGAVLNLYPECPMAWLLTEQVGDSEAGVSQVRDAVLRLLPGKDNHAGMCRTFPLHRMFAHKRLFLSQDMTELVEAIEHYPNGDRWRVESMARQTHNSTFMQQVEKEPHRLDWSRYFWNSNLAITPCRYE
jgi:hypothetical protein